MIEGLTFPDRGLVRISGAVPNGAATVERIADGFPPYLLRGGALTVTAGGVVLEDSEAPLGIPLTYRATVTTPERLVQQNLMLTPTFLHGQQGWVPGVGRSFGTNTDATSHSGIVGLFTDNPGGVAPTASPTYVGHVSTPTLQNGTYTLTAPTSGGTAVATADWSLLVHSQLSAAATPTVSAGWTLLSDTIDAGIRLTAWKRKRVGGDGGVTVTVGSGAASVGTLLWVRGAIDTQTVSAVSVRGGNLTPTLSAGPVTSIRPFLTVSVLSGQTGVPVTPPGAGNVTGGTWQYSDTPLAGTDTRSITVATQSSTIAGPSSAATGTYAASLTSGVAFQISFQSTSDLNSRTFAKAKAALIPGSPLPYLLTGRFKFTSAGLATWSDIKNIGTWQDVKTARANWLAVRGSASLAGSTFLELYVSITDPGSGVDYMPPVQVLASGDANEGEWLDFSMFLITSTDIPASAEIRLLHGVSLPEYAVQWYLDEVGITSGEDMAHDTLYWFDGDTPVPANPQNYRWPGEAWSDASGDASVAWLGAVGNSMSVFTAPSVVSSSVVTTVGLPNYYPSEPLLLSDPVNSALAVWVGNLGYGDTVHPARRGLHEVLDRVAPISTSRVRGWQIGTLNVLTRTNSEYLMLLEVMASGRILLLRTTYQEYPENNWYVSLGDLHEARPIPNQRESVRSWSVDYARLERPSGLIAASGVATWQDVRDIGTWQEVRDERDNWLDVILTQAGVP